MFYNTTHESGKMLEEFRGKALSQEAKIAEHMKKNRVAYSPYQIRDILFSEATPVTSIRRAMTNLTDDGVLLKLDRKVISRHGRPCHLWVANKEQENERR